MDPVEGTNLLATGRPNAISVVGVAPAGTMYDPGPSFYMQKLVVPAAAKNVVDIEAPVPANLKRIAKALGKREQARKGWRNALKFKHENPARIEQKLKGQ